MSIDTSFASNPRITSVRQQREDVAVDTLTGLWRRRRLILGVTLLSLLAALAFLFMLDRTYRSEAVIRLDFSKREGSIGPEQAPTVMLEAAALIQGEARIIRSRATARRVIEKLKLAEDPRYAAPAHGLLSRLLAPGGPVAMAAGWLGLDNEPPAASRAETTDPAALSTELAIRDVMSHLTVVTENRSYLITLSYTSVEAEKAARIADAFAQDYLQRRLQANAELVTTANAWLMRRIGETQASLREAEDGIAAFRQQTGISGNVMTANGAEHEQPAQQRLRELISQQTAARLALIVAEQRVDRVKEAVRNNAIPSSADLQSVPVIGVLLEREASAQRELGGLRARLGDRHPTTLEAQAVLGEVRLRLNSEIRNAVPVIVAEAESARRTVNELKSQIDSTMTTTITDRRNEIVLREREEEAQVIRDRLTSLTHDSDRLRIVRDLPLAPATLIVPPEVESRPAEPKPIIILATGGSGGLIIALVLALWLERRDQGLRTRADVTPEMDIRCVAMVPELRRQALPAVTAGAPAAVRDAAAFQEAIYLAGASVGLLDDVSVCRTVLITSAMPGEGRSTFCRALGLRLAAAGRRVLVVDAMPPHQPHPTDAEPDPMPVSSLAAGKSSGCVHYYRLPRTAGVICQTDAFRTFIEDVRQNFDVILLEAPPVMLLGDALVLSRYVDTVLLLARWATTKRRVVSEALQRLREHSIAVDGLVLTRVNLRRHARLQFFDDCFLYSRERRFYDALSGRDARLSSISGPRS